MPRMKLPPNAYPASESWAGWIYQAGAWSKACESAKMPDCSRQLSLALAEAGLPAKCSCLTRGSTPTFTPSV